MTAPTAAEVAAELERLVDVASDAVKWHVPPADGALRRFVEQHRDLILSALRAPSAEPSEADVERVGRAIYLGLYERHGGRWECVETKDVWFDLARAALRSRRAEGGE
jgi:hypothetical protein